MAAHFSLASLCRFLRGVSTHNRIQRLNFQGKFVSKLELLVYSPCLAVSYFIDFFWLSSLLLDSRRVGDCLQCPLVFLTVLNIWDWDTYYMN